MSNKSENIIELKNIKKYFSISKGFLPKFISNKDKSVKAVDGISFTLKKGDIFGLVGESGCGKTTTARAIGGLDFETEGEIYWKDTLTKPKFRKQRNFRKNIQFIFQNPYASLHPRMKIGKQLSHALIIQNQLDFRFLSWISFGILLLIFGFLQILPDYYGANASLMVGLVSMGLGYMFYTQFNANSSISFDDANSSTPMKTKLEEILQVWFLANYALIWLVFLEMIPKIWELLEVTLFYLNFITVFLIYFLNKKNVSDLTINSERGIIHKLKSYFFLIWIVIGFLFINIGLLDFIPNTFGFNVGKITGILFILIGIGYFYYQNYIPYKLATKELSEQKIIIMDLKFLVFFIFGFVLIVLSYYSLLPVVYNFRSGFIAGYLLIIIGVGLFNKYNFIPNNSFKPNNNLLAKSNKYDIYFIIIFIAGIIIFSLGYSNIVPNLNTFLTVINIGYLTILASFVFFYFFSYNVRKSYFTNKFSAEYTSEKSNNSYLSSQKRFQIQLYSTIAELLLILFSLLGVILVTMGYLNLTPEIDGQQLGFYIGGLFFAIGLLIYYNFSSKQQRNFEDQEVLTTLKYVGLHPPLDYYNKFPHELSGGERQRVAIARAIIVNPEMIIADEPTSMLDVSIRASILDLLFNLKQKLNLTILFITHDLAVAKHFCNQIAIMYVGEIVETGLINEVFNNPRHPYTYTLLKSIPVPDPTYKTDFVIPEGEVPDAINPPSGCRFHPRCPFAEEICAKQKPGYEMISSTHKVACHFHSKLYSEKSLKIN